jgi:hypothetical protein
LTVAKKSTKIAILKNIIRKAEKIWKNEKGGENWGRTFFGTEVLFGVLPPENPGRMIS